MAKADQVREHLEALLGVFVERYRLGEPPYDSPGAQAIEAAIEAGAKADFAALRAVLGGYNLYPHHEARALGHLKAAEEAAAAEAPPRRGQRAHAQPEPEPETEAVTEAVTEAEDGAREEAVEEVSENAAIED